jgi:hypothetical protein
MVGIFLSRAQGWTNVEFILGIIFMAMAIPVSTGVILNIIEKRACWTIILPLFLVAFCVVELLFDYILKLDFRHTGLLVPYLILYFLSLNGMIGYSFLIGKPYGFVTLISYFLSLLATWYSYSKIGHG